MDPVLSLEDKYVETTIMVCTLTDQSCVCGSMANIWVSVLGDVHGIPYLVGSANEVGGDW